MPSAFAAVACGVGMGRVEIHQSLRAHAAIFGKAETQRIDASASCNIGGVTTERGDSIGKTRAVHMKAQLVLLAKGTKRRNFGG